MKTTQIQLNYDPSDPDKMKLQPGVTCGDCRHIKRCKSIFGHVETDTYCDWSPSRFHLQDHPLAGLHINQGSMDAAADAYEAEYNAAQEARRTKCI
mgnify:FL=1